MRPPPDDDNAEGVQLPQEFANVLRPHLDRVRPLVRRPANGRPAVYTLHIRGASAAPNGEALRAGEGTFVGPLDLAKRDRICEAYATHMPCLGDRLDAQAPGALLVVTCEIMRQGGGGKMHYTLMGMG